MNILMSADEFMARSLSDDRAVFVFLSNLWDAARIFTIRGLRPSGLNFDLAQYRQNYSTVVSALYGKLNQTRGDVLILQIAHAPANTHKLGPTYSLLVSLLNVEVASLALDGVSPLLFRADIAAGVEPYLEDHAHQNIVASRRMADLLLELVFPSNLTIATRHHHHENESLWTNTTSAEIQLE